MIDLSFGRLITVSVNSKIGLNLLHVRIRRCIYYIRNQTILKLAFQLYNKKTAETAKFHFIHYKLMGNISSHSNQSSYPTGTKTQLLVPHL